jgi:large subunit ribosomal protein L17
MGKQLSRSTSHRKALRRNMAASLIEHGAIRTTDIKAKELRGFVEKLITVAKKGTLAARRQVISILNDRAIANSEGEIQDKSVVQKLFDEIAPRYATRNGGYTRIIRLSERRIGDAGKQALLQLVEESKPSEPEAPTAGGRRKRRAAKRAAAGESAPETKE